jgi:hypothetical protein
MDNEPHDPGDEHVEPPVVTVPSPRTDTALSPADVLAMLHC